MYNVCYNKEHKLSVFGFNIYPTFYAKRTLKILSKHQGITTPNFIEIIIKDYLLDYDCPFIIFGSSTNEKIESICIQSNQKKTKFINKILKEYLKGITEKDISNALLEIENRKSLDSKRNNRLI